MTRELKDAAKLLLAPVLRDYGLEAASLSDADRIEGVLRAIWAYNENAGRTRVHREGKVLVVAWHNGVSPSCWEAVNAGVVERLRVPR